MAVYKQFLIYLYFWKHERIIFISESMKESCVSRVVYRRHTMRLFVLRARPAGCRFKALQETKVNNRIVLKCFITFHLAHLSRKKEICLCFYRILIDELERMKNAINWNTDESPARVTPYLVFPSSLEFSYSVYSSPKYFEQKRLNLDKSCQNSQNAIIACLYWY